MTLSITAVDDVNVYCNDVAFAYWDDYLNMFITYFEFNEDAVPDGIYTIYDLYTIVDFCFLEDWSQESLVF